MIGINIIFDMINTGPHKLVNQHTEKDGTSKLPPKIPYIEGHGRDIKDTEAENTSAFSS